MDGHPAPNLEDCLRQVAGASCFSSIDLKAGFHNIPIDLDSQRFTGIVTQDGAYQYLRLYFGLTNAPAHF